MTDSFRDESGQCCRMGKGHFKKTRLNRSTVIDNYQIGVDNDNDFFGRSDSQTWTIGTHRYAPDLFVYVHLDVHSLVFCIVKSS